MKRKIDVRLRKVANSYVITIPIELVKKFNLKKGDFLEIDLYLKEGEKE